MSDRKSNITPKRRINEFNDRSLIEKKLMEKVLFGANRVMLLFVISENHQLGSI